MTTGATLVHRTIYHYARPVRLGPQWLRLRPLPDPRGAAPEFRLTVDPVPGGLHWQMDPWGNQVGRLLLPEPVRRLSIEVVLGLDLSPRNPFDFVLDGDAAAWPFRYQPAEADALAALRRADQAGPLLDGLRAATAAGGATVETLLAWGAAVRDRLDYEVRMEPGVWLPERTLAEGRGSCRDAAWLLVQLLRLHGVAARFVSGYLVQRPEDGAAGAELHAWAEAFLPGAGWVGVDATSGLLTAEGHVALAASPEPAGTAPLSGTVEPTETRLETSIALRQGEPAAAVRAR